MTKVLIVQGAEPDRDLLWAFLNGIQCQVDTAPSLEEAEPLFEQHQHRLVIADVRPTRGDGLEVARRLHDLSKRLTPVLFVSGTASEEEVMRQADPYLQVIGLLRKPIFIVDLVYKIRQWIQMPEEATFLQLLERLEPGDAGISALDELLRTSGDLSRVSLARVLYAVFETRRTGCLTIASGDGFVRIYTHKGEIIYLESQRETDHLIASLRRQGRIDAARLPSEGDATTLQDQIGLLLATRAVAPHKVKDAVAHLLTEVVETLSDERSGIFRLEPIDPPARLDEPHSPLRILLGVHARKVARLDDPVGEMENSELVVRLPLGLDISKWMVPAMELRMLHRLRAMVGRPVVLGDFLRVYAEGDVENQRRLRALLDLLEDISYLDFRPSEFTKEDADTYRELLEEAFRIRHLDHFALLRVRANDSLEKLKQAYLDASRLYHPDRYYTRPQRVSDLAGFIQSRYQDAYEVLKHENKRKQYVSTLGDANLRRAGVSDKELHDPGRATIFWKEAERFMKVGKWEEAQKLLDEAIRFDPQKAIYLASRSWVVFNRDPKTNHKTAMEGLRRATDMNNNCDRAHYYMGMVAKNAGEHSKAELYFSRAIAANSENFEASREIRLLQRRAGANGGGSGSGSADTGSTAPKKSFLSGLFGRKKS